MTAPRRPITRRGLLRGAAGVGLGSVLAGCATGERPRFADEVTVPTLARDVDSALTKVAVVGDSITEGSRAALVGAFASIGIADPVIDAESGRRITVGNGRNEPTNGVQATTDLLLFGVAPDVWVFALGTNDVGSYEGPDEYGALVDQLLALPPVETPVVWIDVFRPQYPEDTNLFNQVVRERLAARGNGSVRSWYDLCNNPALDLLQSDRIHPNEAGRSAFANLVVGAAQAAV